MQDHLTDMKKDREQNGDSVKKSKNVLKKIGILILSFVVVYGLLRLIIELSLIFDAAWIYYVGTSLFGAAAVGVCIAFFVLNGYTLGKEMRTEDELPDRWSDEKKKKFMSDQPKNKKRAESLIYVIFALVLTVVLSYIELMLLG